MIHISKSPDTPFTAHERGPHFYLTDQRLLHEIDGEDAYELPLKDITEYLAKDPENKTKIEAMALISNNSGMALTWHFHPDNRTVDKAFLPQSPAVAGGVVTMRMDSLALVLGRNPYPDVKASIIEFLSGVGIQPNMDRINKEFCATCK